MIELGKDTLKFTWETANQLKIWVLYAESVLFLLFQMKNKIVKAYVKCGIVSTMIVLNPLFAGIVASCFLSMSRYFRLFWIVPIYYIIAIAAAELSDRKSKWLFFICSGLICGAGRWIYLNDFHISENFYKLPQEAVEICEYFSKTQEYQSGRLKISVDPDLSSYIRQIDASIILQYGREAGLYSDSQNGSASYYQLKKDTIRDEEVVVLANALKADNCQYVVIGIGKVDISAMQINGYAYICTIDGYEIYKLEPA